MAIRLTDAIWKPEKPLPGRFYADDVILVVSELWELLLALQICEKWAHEFSMRWSTNKKKSQLLLHPKRLASIGSLPFAGGYIQEVPEARYLGVQLTSKGISVPGWAQRTFAAQQALQRLSAANLIFPGVDPVYARSIFHVFIERILDYMCFATPVDQTASDAIEKVYARFFAMVLGIRVKPKQTPTLRLMFRMENRQTRNEFLALKFRRRIESLALKETEQDAKVRDLENETLNAIEQSHVCHHRAQIAATKPHKQRKLQLFQTIARKMKRPIQADTVKLPTALRLKSSKLRALAAKWHLGVFPIHAPLLKRIGYASTIRDLELLCRSQLSNEDYRRLEIALETASALDSTNIANKQ